MRSAVTALGLLVGRARLLPVALSVVLCLGLWVSGASAGKGVVSVFGAAGSGDGQFAFAGATAVNLGSGDVYVVDQGNNRVERFDANGAFVGAFGWGVADGSAAAQTCSSNCQAGQAGSGAGQFDTPQGIAIDQSDGSVYVVDGPNNNRVEKFDASGNYLSQFGSAGSAEGQFSGAQGIAVDPADQSVYVADAGNNRIERFDNTGAFADTFGFGVSDGNNSFETCTSSCQAGLAVGDASGFSGPTRVAVDSVGRIYILDAGNGRIERFTNPTTFDQVFDPTDVNSGTFAFEIAVGPGNDHLYVAQAAPDFSEQRVFEIDDTGSLIDTHGVGSGAGNASGLALNSGAQRIYLADGFNARVFTLDDVTPPAVTIDPAGSVTATSASLSGAVTPNGSPNVGWHFETSTDDANWSPVATDQNAGNGSAPVPVGQNLTNLIPNTTYFVRLAATRPFNAPTFSSETQFTTTAIPPTVTTQPAQDVGPTHAALPGLINPNNQQTTYYFQYGTTTAYGMNIPATQDGDAGSASVVGAAGQRIDGLQSGTTYHFRLVATNPTGTTTGQDQTFTTTTEPPASNSRAGIPGAGFLPDQRGWEQVSPSDKNGGDVMADSQRTRVAADGNAVQFTSLAAFADAVGTGLATDYMSTRGSHDWATHAITPAQRPLNPKAVLTGLDSLYEGYFSSDLTKGVFLGVSPLSSDPNVAAVANIYLRSDLRTPGAGIYQLLSPCPLCDATNTPLPGPLGNSGGAGRPFVAGASAGFGHVIFESQEPRTSDAPAGCDNNLLDTDQCPPNLYEWDHGTLRLVDVLPDGECGGAPPCVAHLSQAGQSAIAHHQTPATISADGSRIFFTVPDFVGFESGQLYMRLNHSVTVKLNTSERTAPDPSPQSATYWDASADGSRVFFTTSEALTNDAPLNGDVKLYMYDTIKPDSDPHNLTLLSRDGESADPASVATVLGASGDGHYVYFTAQGQLVAGQPVAAFGRFIYVWHDGTVRFVAPIDDLDPIADDTSTTNFFFRLPVARVTPDGKQLLFSSTAPIGPTGYPQVCGPTRCRQLYVYSYDSERIECASCNPSGAPPTVSAFDAVQGNNGTAFTTSTTNTALSGDGQHAFFSTVESLVPQDRNGKIDVYEYDVASGTPHLITTGRDTSDSYFLNASPSGDDVFFITRARLVGSDTDNSYDLYDARVNGGFPEPAPAQPACTGDGCRGPQGTAPSAPVPGSGLVTQAAPRTHVHARAKPKACRKGYVRKKVHGKTICRRRIKRHKFHHQSHHSDHSRPRVVKRATGSHGTGRHQ